MNMIVLFHIKIIKLLNRYSHTWVIIDSEFNKWQIFHNDPGYANTNSNIESFNATFKRNYTKYNKCSILSILRKLIDCVIEYGNKALEKNVYRVAPKFDRNKRKGIPDQ